MAFSSTVFLFVFLPALLLIYYCKLVKSNKTRNIILLIASLLFYAYGEPIYILIIILSIIINYFIGLMIDKTKEEKKYEKLPLIVGIIFNIGLLIIYKYLNFIFDNLSLIFNKNILGVDIALPLGLSFYTFSILSYIIDVYKGEAKAEKNIIRMGSPIKRLIFSAWDWVLYLIVSAILVAVVLGILLGILNVWGWIIGLVCIAGIVIWMLVKRKH